MIKFFRHIRKEQMEKGKTGKYFKYAIGEIILVVIGILIALSINNWNERRINEKKIVSFLQEIKKNLVVEIERSNSVIKFYNRQDSLLQLVVSNKIKRQDFFTNRRHSLQMAIMNYAYTDINTNAYNNLILISNDIPSKYKSLYEDLYVLYDLNGKSILERKDKLYRKMTDFFDYLRNNKEWYSVMLLEGEVDEKAINYFMEDGIYKNYVYEYYDDAMKVQDATINYKEKAELVYKKIIELEEK
jgi:Family of unknown function (DUF6090)